MSIIYSAIVPHSPLLVPAIGKENTSRLQATIDGYRKIEEDLYSLQPDTIVIISPHGLIQQTAFTMNLCPDFVGKFEEFGDFSTRIEASGDIGLAYKIKQALETKTQLQLTSNKELDYGTSIPLFMLAKSLPNIKIIPIYYSELDLQSHYDFGILLQKELTKSNNRIAVISSGDLSHRLAKNSPAGYSAKGKKFDQKIITILSKNKNKEIFKIDAKTIEDAGECALRSIAILLGILDGVNYYPQLLSYEYPFGIGYMTMKFEIR